MSEQKRAKVVWVYGPPCSGKSTILKEYHDKSDCAVMDSEYIRDAVGNYDISDEGRDLHLRYLTLLAWHCAATSGYVVIGAITPKREQRRWIEDTLNGVEIDVEFVLADYDMDNLKARQEERFGDEYIDEGFEYDRLLEVVKS